MCGSCNECQYDICVACGRQELNGTRRNEGGGRPDKFEGECFLCGKSGHRQSECWHSADTSSSEHAKGHNKGTKGKGATAPIFEDKSAAQQRPNIRKGIGGNSQGKGSGLMALVTPAVAGNAAWKIRGDDYTAVTMYCLRFQEELERRDAEENNSEWAVVIKVEDEEEMGMVELFMASDMWK